VPSAGRGEAHWRRLGGFGVGGPGAVQPSMIP
jgi:hypothetical protein